MLKRYISAKCHVMCLCMAVAYLTSDNVFKLSKLSVMEGSHRVHVAQDLMRDDEKLKKILADALAKCIDQVDSCHSNERFVPL